MHSLIHLHEVAERYGCLEHCSAYPFESCDNVSRMRWYGHVGQKSNEDWVKRCRAIEIQGKRPGVMLMKSWTDVMNFDLKDITLQERMLKIGMCGKGQYLDEDRRTWVICMDRLDGHFS